MSQQSFPLSWPVGWPRTARADRKRAQFGTRKSRPGSTWRVLERKSLSDALDALDREVRALGVDRFVLSTNLRTRLDGWPRSDQKAPDDVGVALYFTLDEKQIVLPCDKWDTVADNVYAIAMHIGAMRGMERWGVGNLEHAFAGYAALPPAGQSSAGGAKPWHAVLGVDAYARTDDVRTAYRAALKRAHPDTGGSCEALERVQAAWEQFSRERGL